MKKHLLFTGFFALCLSLVSAQAQPHGGMGGPPSGPNFDAAMTKLFGENQAFSANVEFHSTLKGSPVIMSGKMALLDGKSRFEMNLSEMKGTSLPPQAAEQMKTMGMDNMVGISRPDKKVNYVVYPGLQAYAAMPAKDPATDASPDKLKIELTELGNETIDGHPCVKSKAVVTDEKGNTHESTIWTATDMKKFPIKIESTGDDGSTVSMLFKNVQLSKPDAAQFEAPSGFTRYDDPQTMMMQEMMKKMGGNVPPMH